MILIVDNETKHIEELKRYLDSRLIKYKVARKNSKLESFLKHKYRGVILTGGHLRYDQKIDIDEVDINFVVLLELDVPILGICFGHQTIAEAYHGKVKKEKAKIRKTEEITVVKKNELFKTLPKTISMYESHIDSVSKLPYNFEILAKSRSARIEAMKHRDKHIYGIQFHPEASGKHGEKILDNFLLICGYDHIQKL